MIQVTYSRGDHIYDHLRFRSVRFLRKFIPHLLAGGASIISIREV